MLVDLGKDWSSGPPSDFRTFVPISYGVCISCSDYVLNLYANDHNVIDRPLEERENGTCTGGYKVKIINAYVMPQF